MAPTEGGGGVEASRTVIHPDGPPVELATQIAQRASCREVIVVTDGPVPRRRAEPPVAGEPVDVAGIAPFALQANAWASRRAPAAVVVVDRDAVDRSGLDMREATALLGRAAFGLTVSQQLDARSLASELRPLLGQEAFAGGWQHGRQAGGTFVLHEGDRGPSHDPGPPPDDFRVTAFVTVFNEDDVLDSVLTDLAEQQVEAYVLDNWSTDDSWDITLAHADGGAVTGYERWPGGGPSEHFNLQANLERISQLSRSTETDWAIKHDADEIRRSPWRGSSLRDSFWRAQAGGWNVVDFTVLNYQPIDDDFTRGRDLWSHFEHFEFGDKPGHFKQLKAWRNFGQNVDYSEFASHRVAFSGARVFPYKFELHHFPVRSQEHGLRKVLDERVARYLPAARARGWHTHYDHIDEQHRFVRDPGTLLHRDPVTLRAHRLEFLCGAGLPRDG